MLNKLTAKQEAFCQFYVALNEGKLAAVKAGYSEETAKQIACENLTKVDLIERIAEIRAELPVDPDIATVKERKRRLTEHLRAELVDFVGESGDPILSREIPHHQAASEYSVTTRYNKAGEPYYTKSIKLRDPITAIQELNKMEHIYETQPMGNQDNRVLIINVVSDRAKELVEKIGERLDAHTKND